MKVMLFLGSGVSLPTLKLGTQELTNALFDDTEWHSDYDNATLFLPGPESNPSCTYQGRNWWPRVRSFLEILKCLCDKYSCSTKRRKANYEDLFFLAQQVKDEEEHLVYNPATAGFVSELGEKSEPLLKPMPLDNGPERLYQLANQACNFIQCVVRDRLRGSADCVIKGLNNLAEICRDSSFCTIDIATLNHDLLIERVLEDAGVCFANGFDKPDGDIRRYMPGTWDESARVRLFKLHGSIDWDLFYPRTNDGASGRWLDRFGMPASRTHSCPYTSGDGPMFLTGSHNKLVDYQLHIFWDVWHRFNRSLEENNLIVMSGYGWGDLAVNIRIFDWLDRKAENRLLLLHKNIDSVKEALNLRRRRQLCELIREGKMVVKERWLCEIPWADLRNLMVDSEIR